MDVVVQQTDTVPCSFDAQTPLAVVVAHIDAIKRKPEGRSLELVALLSEGHSLYAGRTANEVLKLRSYAMAAMELTGLPDGAMPFVRENLESSAHPYAVAAAARALRALNGPSPEILELLFKSIFTIWRSDRPVNFTHYTVARPQTNSSSGLTEIFRTFAHYGPTAEHILPALEQLAQDTTNLSTAAHSELVACISEVKDGAPKSCCGRANMSKDEIAPTRTARRLHGDAWPPAGLGLQDQDGTRLQWLDFFGHKPTVLAFFYTRCGNPQKCTRTILNLSRIQDEIEKIGLSRRVRISAISYDSGYDTPAALKSYGDARNFRFSDDCRMFRVPDGFDQLAALMELEVSYAQSQVSSHRIEIFLMGASGEIVQSFVRLQSDPSHVLDALLPLAMGSVARKV